MKKLLIVLTLAAMPAVVFGQGRVAFANSSTTQTTSNLNMGAAVGLTDGVNQFKFGLYIAPAGTIDPAAFTLASIDVTGLAATTPNQSGALGRGRFNGGNPLAIQGNAGVAIAFQIRGWSFQYATYEAAVAADPLVALGVFRGASSIGSVTPATAAGPTPSLFGVGAGQVGGFALFANTVPEPSSIALGLLGLGAIALFRRRK